jgi:PhzF family phenazine biosynthesis protein
MNVTIVDAFTREPGAGNRAGVVLDASGLGEAEMRAAARAVAASETAFVFPSSDGDVHVRYFTPAEEIPFCGHATVATFHRLAELGALPMPGRPFLRCAAGRLAVELEPTDGGTRVWITTPTPAFVPSPLPAAQVLALLGGDERMLDRELPIRRAGTKLFIPLARRNDLWGLAPRHEALAAAGREHGVLGYYVFTRDTLEAKSITHARFFAPAVGIREDPVTGAASGPLAVYLVEHGLLRVPGRARVEQGDAMGRSGRVELEVSAHGARIGGVAVTVLEGQLIGR